MNENIDPYNEEDWDEKENLWDIYKPVIESVCINILSSAPLWLISLFFFSKWFINLLTTGDNTISSTMLIVILGVASFFLLFFSSTQGVLKWVKWMNIITVVLMIGFSTIVFIDTLNSPLIYEKSNTEVLSKVTDTTLTYVNYDILNVYRFDKNDSTDFTNFEMYKSYKIGFFNDTIKNNQRYLGNGCDYYQSQPIK